MSYYHGSSAERAFAGFGCGQDCRCTECRSGTAGLGGFSCGTDCRCNACRGTPALSAYGERYIPDDDDDDDDDKRPNGEEREPPSSSPTPDSPVASPTPARRRGRRGTRRRGLAGGPWLGEPPAPAAAGPLFRFECPVGCDPFAAGQCHATLRRAIADAMALCNAAAARLEANPRDDDTRGIFRFFFAHDPSRPVPWAGNRESGAIVAHRLRRVAEALRGRVTHYRCVNVNCPPGRNAFTRPMTEPNLIFLCPRFWTLPRFQRAGVLLHEMLHLIYRGFFRHAAVPPHPDDPQERRRDNAHCYEALVLRLNSHAVEPSDITRCRSRPA